ncbi:MAG TPA: DUF1501 domain-containing protein [Planctomycetota bacterium]|nr:DUF1501 domain-containing protein [Planctomycetota bacterium]
MPHIEIPRTRRDFLAKSGAGFGALAASYLLGLSDIVVADEIPKGELGNPLAPKKPMFPCKAKSVIFLFMEGGPSAIDTFDPKPKVNELAGQPLPPSFKRPITAMGESGSPLLASKRKWKQYGQGGTWVSDWLPNIAGCVDDIAVIRGCHGDGINHSGGVCQMNTGSVLSGRPSLGAWATYGLGTENQSLPAFVVIPDGAGTTINGPRNWGAGFMPSVYQGTRLHPDGDPISNLMTPKGVGEERQREKLDLLAQLNKGFSENHADQTELDARIKSYELAFRMQAEAPGVVDIASESDATRKLYGMDEKVTADFGRNCLLARRMVERGVRFVQLYHGAGSKWDAHSHIETNHTGLCAAMDKPVAGLLKDLKSRGLLDSTLVIWGGEFGRTPMSEKGDGRDHNPWGFTMWMAGGGVKGGQVIGETDEMGLWAVKDRMHVHDIHATILYMLGLDHSKLIYFHKGRPERPTINEGEIMKKIA